MDQHLSSTHSADEQPERVVFRLRGDTQPVFVVRDADHDKPSVPAAYRIYGEERPDFEEGAGAVFWAFLAGVGLAAIVIAFLPF